jgi:hypothetical protein
VEECTCKSRSGGCALRLPGYRSSLETGTNIITSNVDFGTTEQHNSVSITKLYSFGGYEQTKPQNS